MSPDRMRDGRSRGSATLPGMEAVAVNCAPPATGGARVVPVSRQDGGSPYGCDPHRNRMHGGVVLFASLKAVW